MAVTHILVEGKDDLVFIRRLIDVMRAGLTPLDWKLLPPGRDTLTLVSGKFGNCYTSVSNEVIAISETKGFARDPRPYAKYIKADADLQVSRLLVLFDADTDSGADFGGYSNRLHYLQSDRYAQISIGKKFFLFPDDQNDGALEDLAIGMIRDDLDFVIKENWREFRDQLKRQLLAQEKTYYDDTAKCRLSQFCSVVDKETSKDLYWLSALWNENVWNWSADILRPVKSFLQTELPCLFR